VSCPSTPRYALDPDVRLRPLPELGVCLAYTPARPALHRLNPRSWLIASLCDGRSEAELAAAYAAAVGGDASEEEEGESLREGLAQLLALGVVRALADAPPGIGDKETSI
jgi:hypothetical protein